MTPPNKKDKFVAVKLSTGETLIGVLRSEDESTITMEYPFHLKNYPKFVQGGVVETITAGPFCSFTEDRKFSFSKKDLLFYKKMHPFAVPFYLSLWEQHETPLRVNPMGNPMSDDDEGDPLTAEDLKSRIESLIDRMQDFGQSTEEERNEYEELLNSLDKEKTTLH